MTSTAKNINKDKFCVQKSINLFCILNLVTLLYIYRMVLQPDSTDYMNYPFNLDYNPACKEDSSVSSESCVEVQVAVTQASLMVVKEKLYQR